MEADGGGEKLDSQNLRSFLRIKEEDHLNHRTGGNSGGGGGTGPGVTLNSVLGDSRGPGEILPRSQSNRTLLDIIREDSGNREGKKSWHSFKGKLRLRRNGSGSAWTSSVQTPTSDIPIHSNSNRMGAMTRHPSGAGSGDQGETTQLGDSNPASFQRSSSRTVERASGRFENRSALAMRGLQRERNEYDGEVEDEEEEEEGRRSGEGEEEEEEDEDGAGEERQQPVRMSLMSLLAETDRQMGLDGSAFMEEEEEDEEEEESAAAVEYNNCCVCMVRHKGAAFIPCGHTFCRLCSRELFAQRGNCPLCNNYILEILDIF